MAVLSSTARRSLGTSSINWTGCWAPRATAIAQRLRRRLPSERPMTTLFESRLLPGRAPSPRMPFRRFRAVGQTIGTSRATRFRVSRALGHGARIMTLVGARAASPDSVLPC
jgi:hypothetical protein